MSKWAITQMGKSGNVKVNKWTNENEQMNKWANGQMAWYTNGTIANGQMC